MKRLVSLVLLTASSISLHGETLTWDSDPFTPGIQDGSGFWQSGWAGSSDNRWIGQFGTNVYWSNSFEDTAVFGSGTGIAGTVRVQDVTAGKITFNAAGSGNYILTGDSITLAPGAVITTNVDATIRVTLSGSNLIKTGAGTLYLQAGESFRQNSLTGTVTIQQGTLVVGGGPRAFTTDAAIRGNITIRNGATLKLGQSEVIGIPGAPLDRFSPAITIDSGGTFDLSGYDETIGGLSGSGTVIVSKGRRLIINTVNTGAASNFDGTITGEGGLQVRTRETGRVFSPLGDNTYTGATIIGGNDVGNPILSIAKITNGGVASPLGQSTNIPDNLQFNKGTLRYTGATASTDRGALISGSGTIEVALAQTNLTFTGIFAAAGSADIEKRPLIKAGAGTLTLTGSGNNPGATVVVQSGTLLLDKASSSSVHAINSTGEGLRIGQAAIAQLAGSGDDQISAEADVTVDGLLDLNGRSEGFDALTGSGSILNNAPGTFSVLTIGEGNSSSTFRGLILSGPGTTKLVKTGSGTFVLKGANTYTGSTEVNGGTLVLSNPNGAGDVTVTGGGAHLAGSGLFGNVRVADGGTLSADSEGTGGYTSTLTAGSVTFGPNATSVLFDLGNTPNGTGPSDQIHSEGNLSFDGLTAITLRGGPGGIGNGAYTLFSYGGTLRGSEANLTIANAEQYRQTFSFLPTANTPGTVQVDVSGSAANLIWRGGTAGNLWDVNSGTNWANAGVPDRFFQLDTVRFDDEGTASPEITLTGALNPASVLVTNNNGTYTFTGSGTLTAGTALTKRGSGTLLIATSNTHSGGASIEGGVLKIGNSSALGSGHVTVTGQGTLDLNGITPLAGNATWSIAGTGASGQGALVNNGAASLLGANGIGSLVLAGDVTVGGSSHWGFAPGAVINGGDFALTKTGSNDVYWNVASSSSLGDLVIAEGRIVVQGAHNLGSPSGRIVVEAGAELATLGSVTQSKRITLAGGGSLASDVNSDTTWSGPITLVSTNSTAKINVRNFQSEIRLSGKITGPGGLEKIGSGTLELLSDLNDYEGPTIITAGTLRVAETGKLSAKSKLSVTAQLVINTPQSVASLDGSGTIKADSSLVQPALTVHQVEDTEFSGSFNNVTLTKEGKGTLSLIGNTSSYTRFRVDDGTLVLGKTNTVAIRSSTDPGITVNNTGVVRLAGVGGDQIENYTDVSLNAGGTLDMGGTSETIRSLFAVGGRITNSGTTPATLRFGMTGYTSSFSGTIEDGSAPVGLEFNGSAQILEGTYPYTGPTVINSGVVAVNGTIPNSPFTVRGGALAGTGRLGNVEVGLQGYANGRLSPGTDDRPGSVGTLSVRNLLLNNTRVEIDLANTTATSDRIVVQGNLSLLDETRLAVNLTESHIAPGNYTLLTYGGTLVGTNANLNLTLGHPDQPIFSPSTRQTFTVDATGSPGTVMLQVTGNSASLRWAGDGNSATIEDYWDFSSRNWAGNEKFYNLDSVTFDDAGAIASPRVRISGKVHFGGTLVVNNSIGHDYWLTGGTLEGNGKLLKKGTGTLHLSSAYTEQTGGTVISQGTILSDGYNLRGPITLGDHETDGADVAFLLTGSALPAWVPGLVSVSAEGSGKVTLGAVSTTAQNGYSFRALSLNRPTTLIHNGAGESVRYGSISGNVGTLTVTGGKKTVFLEPNTFVGDLVVNGEGTVLTTSKSGIPDGTNVEVGLGATLESTMSNINLLTGSGSVWPVDLSIGSNNGSGTFAGTLAGGGTITKIGKGTQTLTSESSFTGTVGVKDGVLAIHGSIVGSTIEVSELGTLAGSGSVGRLKLHAGGHVSPGDGLDTLSAAELFWNGGQLDFQLGPNAVSDRLDLGSGALIRGAGDFTFDFGGTGEANATYILITFGTTSFQASQFSYVNLAPGLTGSFQLTSNSLQFVTVPETSSFGTLILGTGLLAGRRFRRRMAKG